MSVDVDGGPNAYGPTAASPTSRTEIYLSSTREPVSFQKEKRSEFTLTSELEDDTDSPRPSALDEVDQIMHRGFLQNLRQILLINKYGAILLITLLLVGSLDLLFYLKWNKIELWNVKLYWWFTWVMIMLLSYYIIHITLGTIIAAIESALFFSKIYYYINTLRNTAIVFIWSVIQLPIWPFILHQDNNDFHSSVIRKCLTVLVVVSVTRICLLIADKVVITHLQRHHFWPRLSEFIFKEKILDILLNKPKGKKLDKIRKVIDKKGGHMASYNFTYAWSHVFRKSILSSLKSVEMQRTTHKETTFQEAVKIAKLLYSNVLSAEENVDVGRVEFQLTMSGNHPSPKDGIRWHNFTPFFKTDEDAKRAFKIFDRDGNGEVTLEEAIATVYQTFKDRRSLFITLNDRENIAKIVSNIMGSIYWLIMVLVVVIIFTEIDIINKLLLPLGTFVLAFTFVFGNTLKNIWEALVFIFVVKPFDIGDRITVDGYPTLIINKIALFSTECFSPDGRAFIIPNSFLVSTPITQYKRSRDYAVYVQIQFSNESFNSKVFEVLRGRLTEWMKADKTPWLWNDWLMWVSEFSNNNKITVDIWVELKGVNWSKPDGYLVPTSDLLRTVQQLSKELNLSYSLPEQPILLKKTE